MWERCLAPSCLAEKKIVVAIRADLNYKIFNGVKYVGYTRGCDAVVVAFDEFSTPPAPVVQKLPPKTAGIPFPMRPPGSQGSVVEEPTIQEEEEPTLAETLAHYLECAKRGESIEGIHVKLQEILQNRSLKKLPPVYTWEKAKELLLKEHWNGGAIEWWKSESLEPEPPRIQFRTKFAVEPNETGAEALDKAGIVRLNLPLEVKPWLKQPATVRRFWRAVLGFLAELNTGMQLPAEEMCRIFSYMNTYLPVFWKFRRRKLLYIPDKSESMPLCDPDYFIRLFDFAVTVRRLGVEKIWTRQTWLLPLHAAMAPLRSFIEVRYPWMALPDRNQLMTDCCLDQICAMLWAKQELLVLEKLPELKYDSDCLLRVVQDCIDTCSWSKELERFNADNFGTSPRFKERFTCIPLDSRQIWADVKQHTHSVCNTVALPGPRGVSLGTLCKIETRKIQTTQPVPEFVTFTKENKLIKRSMIDLNWVVCIEEYEKVSHFLPAWLFLMGIRVPLLPVALKSPVNSRMAYTVLIQDDDLWLSQKNWSAKLPLFRVDSGKLYINSGYAAFSRELLKYKIGFLLG